MASGGTRWCPRTRPHCVCSNAGEHLDNSWICQEKKFKIHSLELTSRVRAAFLANPSENGISTSLTASILWKFPIISALSENERRKLTKNCGTSNSFEISRQLAQVYVNQQMSFVWVCSLIDFQFSTRAFWFYFWAIGVAWQIGRLASSWSRCRVWLYMKTCQNYFGIPVQLRHMRIFGVYTFKRGHTVTSCLE